MSELRRLALLRAPSEACGVLLPSPTGNTPETQVVEVPNRHPNHLNSYKVNGHDVMLAIADWYDKVDHEEATRLAVWHSHPSGHVGPSEGDLRAKVPGVAYLVITINSDQSVIPTWF